MPLYNSLQTGHFDEALESLLAQTYPHVAFIFVDDGSTDATSEAIAQRAARDPRVLVTRNPARLGLVKNWCRVFHLAREHFPSARYFAWGSDHDRWHRDWLQRLVTELDAHPEAVMAYPRYAPIDDGGNKVAIKESSAGIETAGLPRASRFAIASVPVGAGNLVYGLFRADALERAGIYPMVYRPDVYLMIELSLYGDFRVVPDLLWYRRARKSRSRATASSDGARRAVPRGFGRFAHLIGIGPITRQHRHTFTGRVPLYSRFPAWLQHVALFFWRLVIRGLGRPDIGRLQSAAYTVRLLRGTSGQRRVLRMSLDEWHEQKRRERQMRKTVARH